MKAETYPFVMRCLPYEYYGLAPCISAETLLYHHDRLYKGYVDRLNQALADYPTLQTLSLWELLAEPENLPESLQTPVKNNGGGVFNHELYFDSLQPLGCEQDPKGPLLEAIVRDFGSLQEFRERIKSVALSQFASGYAWLVLGRDERLKVLSTANQDTPDLKSFLPLLNVDVWEHSYYLQYQNRRNDYLCAWLRLINWRKVSCRYEEALDLLVKDKMLRGEYHESRLETGEIRTQAEDRNPAGDRTQAEDRMPAEDRTQAGNRNPAGDRTQAEDRNPAEDRMQAEARIWDEGMQLQGTAAVIVPPSAVMMDQVAGGEDLEFTFVP